MKRNFNGLAGTLTAGLLATGLALTAGSAHAALVSRGNGMIYDTVLNVTWLADMNYAQTSHYADSGDAPGTTYNTNSIWSNGRMGWDAAKNWANGLVYRDYSDWTLPTLDQMIHLFVTDLGHSTVYESVLTTTGDTDVQKANLSLFTNVKESIYWGSEEKGFLRDRASSYDTLYGFTNDTTKYNPFYALAVRVGDVAAASTSSNDVPEPGTLALLPVAALAAWGATRRRVG